MKKFFFVAVLFAIQAVVLVGTVQGKAIPSVKELTRRLGVVSIKDLAIAVSNQTLLSVDEFRRLLVEADGRKGRKLRTALLDKLYDRALYVEDGADIDDQYEYLKHSARELQDRGMDKDLLVSVVATADRLFAKKQDMLHHLLENGLQLSYTWRLATERPHEVHHPNEAWRSVKLILDGTFDIDKEKLDMLANSYARSARFYKINNTPTKIKRRDKKQIQLVLNALFEGGAQASYDMVSLQRKLD